MKQTQDEAVVRDRRGKKGKGSFGKVKSSKIDTLVGFTGWKDNGRVVVGEGGKMVGRFHKRAS